jgi:SpoVK/Ycf46/Vps4 family AAA+-type ATPase
MNLRSTNNIKSSLSVKEKLQYYKSENISEIKNPSKLDKFFPDKGFQVVQTGVFDLQDSINYGKRTFLEKFEAERTNYVAIEVQLLNPYFDQRDLFLTGLTIWYIEDEEVGRNNFNLEVKNDWEVVEIIQSWGTPVPGFWKNGECKVEVILENKLVCTHCFSVGESQIVDFQNSPIKNFDAQVAIQPEQPVQLTQISDDDDSLTSVLNELNNFIGLKNLKSSLSDFITYLNFVQERNQKGINTKENISANCIFLGNPGTGKTSVARLLGKFFKSIGLLEHGHVIEVDRAALVGEFIGETPQKTEKVINQAMGGILFIDEAYSLKRNKAEKDFGQESIDIILKRMEDSNGKFFVIAAGYTALMQNFLESNPGLKSRFTHFFTFDDYSPEELTKIYKLFSSKEKFTLTNEAEELLTEKLKPICEQVDETFGNARFIRNLFNETKVQLSKRYQMLPYDERNFNAMSKIIKEDILSAFNFYNRHNEGLTLNEDKLEKHITELNNLVGLDDIKITFNKLLASIKVEQLKKERSIVATPKNFNSIFIAEQGSGTSTLARLFGKIFKELSFIENGQLVEIDSSLFHGLNKIDSYLMVDKMFQESVGKIILVNDSILTLQTKSDFSESLLQYFLKKLYLYKEKVIVILSANLEDIKELLTNVPVVENQFPNIYNFGRYSTRELLEIALNICQKKNYKLDEGAWPQMLDSNLMTIKFEDFRGLLPIEE